MVFSRGGGGGGGLYTVIYGISSFQASFLLCSLAGKNYEGKYLVGKIKVIKGHITFFIP